MLPWLLKNSGSRYVAITYVALGSKGKIKVNLWSGCKSSDSTITSASSSKLPDNGILPCYSQLRLHLNIHPFISFTLTISFHFIRQVKIISFIWCTATTPSPDFLLRSYLLYTKGLLMVFFISLRVYTVQSKSRIWVIIDCRYKVLYLDLLTHSLMIACWKPKHVVGHIPLKKMCVRRTKYLVL
jgi:hypothetical protein